MNLSKEAIDGMIEAAKPHPDQAEFLVKALVAVNNTRAEINRLRHKIEDAKVLFEKAVGKLHTEIEVVQQQCRHWQVTKGECDICGSTVGR